MADGSVWSLFIDKYTKILAFIRLEKDISLIDAVLQTLTAQPALLLLEKWKALTGSQLRRKFGYSKWADLESDFFMYLEPHWHEIRRYHGIMHKTERKQRGGHKPLLSPLEEWCMTLLRIRAGMEESELAEYFGLSTGHVSYLLRQIFPLARQYWVPHYLRFLEPELIKAHTPLETRKLIAAAFPSCLGYALLFGDNTEMIIGHSNDLVLQWKTWSKKLEHFNTLKQFFFCLGDGMIVLAPPVYGGRTDEWEPMESDVVYNSLNTTFPFLLIMDRGFDGLTYLPANVEMVIPPFLHRYHENRTQFEEGEIEWLHLIAHMRFIVERANHSFKQNKIVHHISNQMLDTADDIVAIGVALSNLPFYCK